MSGQVTLAAQTSTSAFWEQLNEIRSTFSKVLNKSVSGSLQQEMTLLVGGTAGPRVKDVKLTANSEQHAENL